MAGGDGPSQIDRAPESLTAGENRMGDGAASRAQRYLQITYPLDEPLCILRLEREGMLYLLPLPIQGDRLLHQPRTESNRCDVHVPAWGMIREADQMLRVHQLQRLYDVQVNAG
jgi:hypothetical protein